MDRATELLVLTFMDETKAGEILKIMQRMIAEGRISVLDIAVLVKYKDGRTAMKDTQEVDPTHGTLFGAIIGGLIGAVEGPVGAVIGAVAGATAGGAAAHAIDSGFPDDYLQALQANLRPGGSALIVLTKAEWSNRVIEAVAEFGGRVIRHVLTEDLAAYLAAVATFDSDQTPASELPAKLETQIVVWQAEVEALTTKMATNGATKTRARLVHLQTLTHLAQEKLHDLWTIEIQDLTRQIEVLRIRAAAAFPKAKIMAELEATRAKRRGVRKKLYAQIEARIKSWQVEIEELKARVAEIEPTAQTPVNPRIAALERFASTFDEPVLPTAEGETKARIAALQARVEAAELELQNLYETQIATWQATIKDLQAYYAIPDVADKVEVTERIRELEKQITTAQTRLRAHLKARIAGWQAEVEALQTQVAAAEAADKARIEAQVAVLRAQIKGLQDQATTTLSSDQASASERIADRQAKITAAQAKLKS